MKYSSERLLFREFKENDFSLFYSLFSDEKVMKYALMDRYDNEEKALFDFKRILKNNYAAIKRKAYEFAIFSATNNCFIGYGDIEIQMMNELGGCGEIGYFIMPEHWGNGYATEIANSLIKIGFKYIKLHRITASCNSNNLKSENVMKKVGMQKEGEFRKVRYKSGMWCDEQHYSILSEECEEDNTVKMLS